MSAAQLQLLPLPTRPDYGQPLFSVRIEGEPQRSKHLCVCHGGLPSTRPDPGWATWRESSVRLLRALWASREAIRCPVVVEVVAVFSRPLERRRFYEVRGETHRYPFPWVSERIPYVGTPDFDNVAKAAVDVLVHAGILLDDPLVVDAHTPRFYAAEGEGPCVEVRLWRA